MGTTDGEDCFEAAMMAARLGALSCADVEVMVVHGLVTGQGDIKGLRYTHAWNEVTDENGDVIVWDFSMGKCLKLPRDAYYRVGRITEDEVIRYTAREAAKLTLYHSHFGSWDERFEAYP